MNAISKARHHLAVAKEILRIKAKRLGGHYQHKKYVKMAGRVALKGLIISVDALVSTEKGNHQNLEWYQKHLSELDQKITARFSAVYDMLSLSMSYDGISNAKVVSIGLQEAEKIINWTEQRLAKVA